MTQGSNDEKVGCSLSSEIQAIVMPTYLNQCCAVQTKLQAVTLLMTSTNLSGRTLMSQPCLMVKLTHVIVIITQQEGFFKTGVELVHNVLSSLLFTTGCRVEVS